MIARLKNWLWQGEWSVILELILFAMLGISFAHWTWVAVTPGAIAASTLVNRLEAESIAPMAKRNLFGVAQEGKMAAVADASPTSRIKLLGVVSRGVEGKGRAIFALETGKSKIVEAGWQIEPGFVLKEVHSDHVIVARNGLNERIKLNRRADAKN